MCQQPVANAMHAPPLCASTIAPHRSLPSASRARQVVSLYDVAAGRTAGLLVGHAPNCDGYVTCIEALAAGGTALPHTVASACTDGTVKVWDTRMMRCLNELPGHSGSVRCLAFLGSRLLSGSTDGTVRLWDFDSLLSHDLNGATGGTESAADSPADGALDEFGASFDDKLAGGDGMMMADEDDADYDVNYTEHDAEYQAV